MANMITVQMTREEYERFQAFRGAEKYAQSVRAQDKLFREKAEDLAEHVLKGLDMRVIENTVMVCDPGEALRAIAAACAIVS